MSHTTYHYQYKKRKSPQIIPNTILSAAMGFLLGTQERVRKSSKQPWYLSHRCLRHRRSIVIVNIVQQCFGKGI